MRNNQPVTQKEITIPNHFNLSSTTDLNGTVLSASEDFLTISGYSADEMLGQPHNILRHPDVPAQVFDDMWTTLKQGKDWTGIVKNRAKNGDYYWVRANNSPMLVNNKIQGFVSVRTPATPEEVTATTQLYKQIDQNKCQLKQGLAIKPWQSTLHKFSIKGGLAKTLVIYASIILLVSIALLGSIFYNTQIKPIVEKELHEEMLLAEQQIQNQIAFKSLSVTDIAATAAMMPELQQALAGVADRLPAQTRLSEVQKHFANITDYRNIRIQLYDPEGRSFMRSWAPERFGDMHLDRIRDRALETRKTLGDISVHKNDFGIGVTGYAPVFYQGQLVGVISASGGVGSVVRDLKALNNEWVMVIDQSFYGQRIPPTLANNTPFTNGYLLAHNSWFDNQSIDNLRQHLPELAQGEERKSYFVGDSIIIDLPAYNPAGEIRGRHLMIKPADAIHQQIAQATQQVIWSLASVVLVVLAIIITLLVIISARVIRPLKTLSTSLSQMVKTGRFNERVMRLDNGDEISQIIQTYNRFAGNVQRAITNINDVMSSVAKGQFNVEVTDELQGDLDIMKQSVNGSVASVRNTMDALSTVMDSLYQGQFDTKMPDHIRGEFRVKVNQATESLSAVVADINQAMNKMREGQFNARVTADARGSMAELKQNFNHSMEVISHAITEISRVVASQASGDLTVKLPSGTFKGELHDLKNAINYSSLKMNEVVNVAIDTSRIVKSAADEVAHGASDLSHRVQEQAAALEQTSATMEQMSSQLKGSTQQANQATQMALNVNQQAKQGVVIMTSTIEAMSAIEESSRRISEIVTLIDSIAFQTNLLALNAAVEAARAGDHGRGFAVVAGEVRSLAQKSAQAAKEIEGLIHETATRVSNGAKLANQTGETLNQISNAINEVSSMIEQIAQATEEQSEGVHQVNQAITQIDGVTQQNAALVEQTSAASESLSEQAKTLQQEMNFFKTDAHPSYHHDKEPNPATPSSHQARHKKPTPVLSKPNNNKTLKAQASRNQAKSEDQNWSEF
ncbi:methyl-accepting chemotaxis protein [Thiomicrospira microaerophila]|uniref:methyl-accepting chemotaxis protein n=1 Tax=Thiomicrospira microaerophila TaxID=406020 RepID=UPI000698708D|nr:methyl-accepting chemotaxis protein [Thiomicrospira microaerophila]